MPVIGRTATLGSWGSVELDGASAILKLSLSEDIELPEAVAEDISVGVILLNDDAGRLLYLPYAGDLIIAYDLKKGEPAYPPLTIPRDDDYGLRSCEVRLVPGHGAVYLTELTLARFDDDGTLLWRRDGDFDGWTFEAIGLDEVHLVMDGRIGDERHQARALGDGRPLS